MSLELPKGPGSWPNQTQDVRKKTYEALRDLKSGGNLKARENLKGDVLQKVLKNDNGTERKFDFASVIQTKTEAEKTNKQYQNNDNFRALEFRISDVLKKAFQNAGYPDPDKLMYYSLDYLVNAPENKDAALNIDKVEPGNTVVIHKNAAGKWLLDVWGAGEASGSALVFSGVLFPAESSSTENDTANYVTKDGTGPSKEPEPEPEANFVERSEFENAPNNNFVTKNGVGPVETKPEPNFVERSEFNNAPNNNFVTEKGVGPVETKPEPNFVERSEFGNAPFVLSEATQAKMLAYAAANISSIPEEFKDKPFYLGKSGGIYMHSSSYIKGSNWNSSMNDSEQVSIINTSKESILKELAKLNAAFKAKELTGSSDKTAKWEYKDKTETVFKEELKTTLKEEYNSYPEEVRKLYYIQSLEAKIDSISTQQLIKIREQGNIHLTMKGGNWQMSVEKGIDPQNMWPKPLDKNELPNEVTTHEHYKTVETAFSKDMPSLWPAFARKLTVAKLDSLGKLGGGNLANLQVKLYPNQINFYNKNTTVNPMSYSGISYKEIEASLKKDGFELIGKADYEDIMKDKKYHSKYSTYLYNNGDAPIETGVWSEQNAGVHYDKAPNLATPNIDIGAIPVIRVQL